MGVCGSIAYVASHEKGKHNDDPTRTSLEDVLQLEKKSQRKMHPKSHSL